MESIHLHKRKTIKVIEVICLCGFAVILIINLMDVLGFIKLDTDIPLITAGAEKLYNLIWSYHPDGEYFDNLAFVRFSSRLAELFGRNLFFGFSINKAVFVVTSVGTPVLGFLRYKAKMLKVRNIILYTVILSVLFFISFVVSDAIYIPWDKAGIDSYWM
ncbi:MAG: hypothetical protein IJ827_02255 [Lachnospiraceae bacterium]|nr:hypothetical protein [Lachnospiraceae bacterium]